MEAFLVIILTENTNRYLLLTGDIVSVHRLSVQYSQSSAVIQQGDCTAGSGPGAALFLHPPRLQGNESTDASEVSHETSHDGETIIMIIILQPHKHQCYGIVQQVLRQSAQSAQREQEEILA